VYYPHPYQAELNAYEPPDAQLERVVQQEPADDEESAAIWIDDIEGLKALKRTLDTETEFAVDLEAHGYRTYASFTCLMQLSTRSQDYLVDVIALRSEVSQPRPRSWVYVCPGQRLNRVLFIPAVY
jgi:exosome complex exonuclease RRP6